MPHTPLNIHTLTTILLNIHTLASIPVITLRAHHIAEPDLYDSL